MRESDYSGTTRGMLTRRKGLSSPPKQCCNCLILKQFFGNGKLFKVEDVLISSFGRTAAVWGFSRGVWLVAERFALKLSSGLAELVRHGYRFH